MIGKTTLEVRWTPQNITGNTNYQLTIEKFGESLKYLVLLYNILNNIIIARASAKLPASDFRLLKVCKGIWLWGKSVKYKSICKNIQKQNTLGPKSCICTVLIYYINCYMILTFCRCTQRNAIRQRQPESDRWNPGFGQTALSKGWRIQLWTAHDWLERPGEISNMPVSIATWVPGIFLNFV